MTILPTKRTTSSGEDNSDNTGQGGNSERSSRRRDEHSTNHIDTSKSGNRRTFRRSATPESSEHSLRKRFKENKSSGSGNSAGQMARRHRERDNQNTSTSSNRDSRDNRDSANNKSSPSHSQPPKTPKRAISNQGQQPIITSTIVCSSQQSAGQSANSDVPNVTGAIHAPDDLQTTKATTDVGGVGVGLAGVLGIVPLGDRDSALETEQLRPDQAPPMQQKQQDPLEQEQQQKLQVQDGLLQTAAQQVGQQLQLSVEDADCTTDQRTSGANNVLVAADDEATGFNSEDEYSPSTVKTKDILPATGRSGKSSAAGHVTKDGAVAINESEWHARDVMFARCLTELGYEVKPMHEDGACLFRAIADQVYGDQEMHYVVRSHCMDYIVKNKDFFAPYVTEDFDKYVARKRQWHVHGNHLEIQAMSEMYNRRIEVYCYCIEPINIFSGLTGRGAHGRTYEPIRLSYHRMCHYNSISNPDSPSVGVGLGLPAYHPIDLNRRRLVDAVRASEQLLIEQTMLEDKLQATDWEATSEAIEEAVARESYIQYYRDAERRVRPPATPTATVTTASNATTAASTSATVTDRPVPGDGDTNRPQDLMACAGNLAAVMDATLSCSAASEVCIGQHSPQASSSRTTQQQDVTNTGEQSPNAGELSEDEWNDGILAQILAESRKTYFDELKRNSKKGSSPGPSTSR